MTLADQMDKANDIENKSMKVAGQTLLTCIKQAYRRHGITCGLTPCAQVLKSNTSGIMLCVLSESSGNVSTHIHQTLIEAFCRENNIPVLKVKDSAKLSAHVQSLDQTKLRGGRSQGMDGKPDDVSCILLETPKRGRSKHDDSLIKFCKFVDGHAHNYLTMPD